MGGGSRTHWSQGEYGQVWKGNPLLGVLLYPGSLRCTVLPREDEGCGQGVEPLTVEVGGPTGSEPSRGTIEEKEEGL